MVLPNAQSKTFTTRGNQKDRQHESVGNQSTEIRPIGEEFRNQSFRSGRNDSERRDELRRTGGYTPGGTIKQLIAETLDELEQAESTTDKLRSRLVQLTNLLESVDSPPIEDTQKE
jgi:hypothetical protein